VKQIEAEDVLEIGGVRIEVLNPIPGSRENVSSNNGSSSFTADLRRNRNAPDLVT
jgi:hypothetical protein